MKFSWGNTEVYDKDDVGKDLFYPDIHAKYHLIIIEADKPD